MKVTRATRVPLRLPLRRPLRTAHGVVSVRETLLLRIESDEGHVGYGEAAPLPAFGTETLAASAAALERVEARLGALEPREPERVLETLAPLLAERPVARAALDAALRDLVARSDGRSLASALAAAFGRHARERVPVHALLAEDEPTRAAAEAAAARRAGMRSFKLKLTAASLDRDLDRVAAVRAAVGREAAIRVDANGSLDEETALRVARTLGRLDVELFEQPVSPADIAALARVRARAGIAIAADEAAASLAAARCVLAAEAADVLVAKPAVLGGPGATLALAEEANARGVPVLVTSALESAIGVAAALAVAAALPAGAPACGLATSVLLADDVAAPLAPRDGALAVPLGAGIGVVPIESALARLRGALPAAEIA